MLTPSAHVRHTIYFGLRPEAGLPRWEVTMGRTYVDDRQQGRLPLASERRDAMPTLVRYGDVAHVTNTQGPPGPLEDNPNVVKTRTV